MIAAAVSLCSYLPAVSGPFQIENAPNKNEIKDLDNGMLEEDQHLHLRWNSQKGRIFIDGSHLVHNLELGDEILIDSKAPPLALYSDAKWD